MDIPVTALVTGGWFFLLAADPIPWGCADLWRGPCLLIWRVAHFSGEYTLSREPLAAKMKGVPHFSWFSRSAQQTACTTSS